MDILTRYNLELDTDQFNGAYGGVDTIVLHPTTRTLIRLANAQSYPVDDVAAALHIERDIVLRQRFGWFPPTSRERIPQLSTLTVDDAVILQIVNLIDTPENRDAVPQLVEQLRRFDLLDKLSLQIIVRDGGRATSVGRRSIRGNDSRTVVNVGYFVLTFLRNVPRS